MSLGRRSGLRRGLEITIIRHIVKKGSINGKKLKKGLIGVSLREETRD